MSYTVKAGNARDWGKAVWHMLKSAASTQEIDEIMKVHHVTITQVDKYALNITNALRELCEKRKDELNGMATD